MDLKEKVLIQNFLNNSLLSNEQGILRANRFVCIIDLPLIDKASATYNSIKNSELLMWHCFSANCPDYAIDIESTEVNSWNRLYFKSRTDQDLELTFFETADLKLRSFFAAWIDEGYNNVTMSRRYIKEIEAKSLKIIPINGNSIGVKSDIFWDVVPSSVNSLDFDVSAENSYLKTSVKFKYRFHTIDNVNVSKLSNETAEKEKAQDQKTEKTYADNVYEGATKF